METRKLQETIEQAPFIIGCVLCALGPWVPAAPPGSVPRGSLPTAQCQETDPGGSSAFHPSGLPPLPKPASPTQTYICFSSRVQVGHGWDFCHKEPSSLPASLLWLPGTWVIPWYPTPQCHKTTATVPALTPILKAARRDGTWLLAQLCLLPQHGSGSSFGDSHPLGLEHVVTRSCKGC